MRWIGTTLVLVLCTKVSVSEIFSAVHNLQKLFENEQTVIDELESFIGRLSQIVNDFKRMHHSLKDNHDDIKQQDIERLFANPLHAFLLLKRMTYDIKLVGKRVADQAQYFNSKVGSFATENDLNGAVEGILRLQKLYKLKATDLAAGIIDGEATNVKLSPNDLYLIGSKAQEMNENFLAREYLELSLADTGDEGDVIDILFSLTRSYEATGDFEKAIEILDRILEVDPTALMAIFMKEDFEKLQHEQPAKNTNDNLEADGCFHVDKEEILYGKACRGELIKSEKEIAKLYCRFHATNSFTKLSPFKVEVINSDPEIILFNDVMSDGEIEHIRNLSISKIHRATIFSAGMTVSSMRVAQVAWHEDKHDEVIARISRRIQDMTGLSTASSEQLQVQNYGIGGHYHLHWDHRSKGQPAFDLGTGNRIATVLFYLSDVEKGGATVFPYLNVHVSPVKGTAVFWFNLKSSGASEHLSRHGGCPVLIGSKWLVNKWIHELGQDLKCFEKIEETEPTEFFEENFKEFYFNFN